MKTLFSTLCAIAVLWLIGTGASAEAAGLMRPVDGGATAPQIRSHHVDVTIEDGFAVTRIDQVFHNPNAHDLEAFYAFPVPEGGVVSEFTVWIDGQPVTGEVLKAERAEQVYQAEKAAGREAGLASKKAHYRFEVRVSPVRAGAEIRVRLSYLQDVRVDTGVGRYVYPLESGETDEAAMAFWTADEQVRGDFSFTVNLRSAHPLSGVRLPSHPGAVIDQRDAGVWQVQLGDQLGDQGGEEMAANLGAARDTGPAFSLDRDIVLYWRLQDGLPASVDLITHREPGAARGTFMLTLTPADDLAPITEGRDWVFVLDMSGSMRGKYRTLVDGVQRALGKLQAGDRFRIVRFNKGASELTPGWQAVTDAEVRRWGERLANTGPEGGTNLYAGLERALSSLDSDRTSAVVLVTDGEANVGVTEKTRFIELIRSRDARLFTATMGNSANRPLLDAMTRVSNGFAVSVSNTDDIVGKLLEFTSKVSHEAMHDINVEIAGVRVGDLSPEQLGSLYRGEQLRVFGHYWGEGELRLAITGKVSGREKTLRTHFPMPAVATDHPEIERLWAWSMIRELQARMEYFGADEDTRDAIADLGVEYGLVTDRTSMVVMREEQFAAHGIERRNRDRLERERVAVDRRAAQPVQSRRVDTHAPAASGQRASHRGGGALGGGLLVVLALLALARRRG